MEYTPEQLNYFRICYVAFNLVSEGLRKLFKQEWDFLYKTTLGEWKDTPKNGLDFYNKESRKSRSKNSRYLGTVQNGNTAEWDCSCLFFAILFSDSIGTTLSAAIKKEVDDLRQVRNDIAHISEAKLTDAEFRDYVGRVLLAFNSLKLPMSDIEAVKIQTNFPTTEVSNFKVQVANLHSELKNVKSDLQVAQDTIQEKEEQVECLMQEINSKVESFCNLTFKPAHQIIRRSNDVTRIMTKMQELYDGSSGAVSTIHLSGNPGCGKTQLARQIGEEFFKLGSGESEGLTFVATLNAESLEALADSYLNLAKQMGIPNCSYTKMATTKAISSEEKIQHLRCLILPRFKQFSKWLIIADNVADLSSVCKYLPQTASEEWGHGQVLITTQDTSAIPTNSPHTYHESLSAGMQPEDAVELLEQVSQISIDGQVQKVAEVLEYQPLALAAAAFYVQYVRHGSPTYGWIHYLERVTGGSRDVTEEPLADRNPAYSKTMTAAIKMALESILESDEILRQTFLLFSLCDSEPLPFQTAVNFVNVRTSGQTDELTKTKILNSSLIMVLYSEDASPGYLRVHNVVHQVLRKMSLMEVTEKYQCLSVAVQVFHSLIESEKSRVRESGDICILLRRITTHCKALYQILTNTFSANVVWVKELTPFISPDNFVSWLSSTASVFIDLCNPSSAMLFSKSACDFVQYISGTREGDVIKATVFDTHGSTLSMTCQYTSSIFYHEEAAKIYRTVYGEHHFNVAASYNNLGSVYRDLGQYTEAKEYHEMALIIRNKIFGEQHGDNATSYNNLAIIYQDLGQYNEAKKHHEKALIILKNSFGEEHADVAASYNNLGIVSQDFGEYTEAKEYYEKEEHAAVAASYNNLGGVYQDLGRHNEAKEYYNKALIVWKKIFGEEHANVAASYNNLGIVYRNLGQYNEAKEYYEKALIIKEKIFGEEHADVAASYNNLGGVYQDLGRHNEAKDYYNKALIIWKKIFGEEHANVAASYNNLGIVYRNLGQYNEAKEYYEKALIIRKKIFGQEHAAVAASYNNLGNVYQDLGRYYEAEEYHNKALIIREKIFGEEHANVAASYNNLGIVYCNLGQYTEAKKHHEKALILWKKIFGEEHADVAESYNNLGSVYQDLGQYNEAKESYEKALIIKEKIFGEEHAAVAASYNNLGSVYQHLGRHNEAKEYLEKALIIREKIFGEEHADNATSYNNLGIVYQDLGQYNEAKEYYEKALIIRKKIFGEEHAVVAASYNNMATVYYNLGQYNKAKEHYEMALINSKKIFGEEHVNVAASYYNLGSVYRDLGQYNEAKEYHEKALIIRKKIFGEKHPDIATSYSNLRDIYQDLGQCIGGKEHYEKVLKIFDEENADVLSLNNLGSVHQNVEQVSANYCELSRR